MSNWMRIIVGVQHAIRELGVLVSCVG
jgi:hypothetical protein